MRSSSDTPELGISESVDQPLAGVGFYRYGPVYLRLYPVEKYMEWNAAHALLFIFTAHALLFIVSLWLTDLS